MNDVGAPLDEWTSMMQWHDRGLARRGVGAAKQCITYARELQKQLITFGLNVGTDQQLNE